MRIAFDRVRDGKVVYAFDDKVPRHSARARNTRRRNPLCRSGETKQEGPPSSGPVWVLDIEEFS
jgi:hypothetical protein